jgi:hypothetical protein
MKALGQIFQIDDVMLGRDNAGGVLRHYRGRLSDMFLMWADGWWELYMPHEDWRRKFRKAFPEAYERTWQSAGESPD